MFRNDEKWKEAESYLTWLISEYKSIGWSGQFALNLVLMPLKKRLDDGERSEELYKEIMSCE